MGICGASTVGVVYHRSSGTAGQQTDDDHTDQEKGQLFHDFTSKLFVVSIYDTG
jgi:hypothetical protein